MFRVWLFFPAGVLLGSDFFLLAANAASPQGVAQEIRETFENGVNLDEKTSSGTWGGFRAVPGRLGGDGRHGSFDATLGTQPNPVAFPDRYVWNTDNMVIPGSMTLSGQDETVTDGRFFFTDFTLATGQTVVFTGQNPVRIFVRGKVIIHGTLDANGVTPSVDKNGNDFRARPGNTPGPIVGQAGGLGGPGGARGGDGGDSAEGDGSHPRFSGQDGENVGLPAGHAYLNRTVGTGGIGALQFPETGLDRDVTYRAVFGTASGMVGSGGGGGGFVGAGGEGMALDNPSGSLPSDLGPPTAGGADMDPFPIPSGTSSLEHFSFGGSGAGGGGSHPFLASTAFPDQIWRAGAAGGGGGGSVTLRAGNEVRIAPLGRIEARGGSGTEFVALNRGFPQPGGGGSGGTILLQSGQDGIAQDGTLDASGGESGIMFAGGLTSGRALGGEGAPGVIRMETPGGDPTPGNTLPQLGPQNIGVLTDRDTVVGAQSLWYSTDLVTPPKFLRYELEATIDGQQFLFSDDPIVGVGAANDPNAPIRVLFQAGQVDPTRRVADPDTIGPWRSFVNSAVNAGTINDDQGNGVRFALLFNRSAASEIAVTRVSVFFLTVTTGVATFGTSTFGCDGPLPIGVISEPTTGNSSFAITCSHAPRNVFGALVLSGDRLSTPMFAQGVEVWVDLTSPLLAAPLVLSDSLGAAQFSLPVPASPSLVGLQLFGQFAWPDSCARGGLSASNALSMLVH